MRINELFKKVKEIDEMLGNQLLEISVKQHQITISTKEPNVYFNYVQKLIDASLDKDSSFISFLNDVLYFVFSDLSVEEMKEDNLFYLFMLTISDFSEKVCKCPSLEFVISPQYIKCFLDKPGLTIDALSDYEDVLEAKGKAELELHPQRAYLLFINEDG